MKNLQNLKGVSTLSKQQQQSIHGGSGPSNPFECAQVCGVWIAAFQVCIYETNGCA